MGADAGGESKGANKGGRLEERHVGSGGRTGQTSWSKALMNTVKNETPPVRYVRNEGQQVNCWTE